MTPPCQSRYLLAVLPCRVAWPAHGRRDVTGMSQERDANPPRGTRPPEYVIVTWVSAQLRQRIQGLGMSLDEALRAGKDNPEPDQRDADREAEP